MSLVVVTVSGEGSLRPNAAEVSVAPCRSRRSGMSTASCRVGSSAGGCSLGVGGCRRSAGRSVRCGPRRCREAEVLARDVDAVAVDRAGVADVGLLLGLGPVAGEGGGSVDGRALGGEAVQRIVEPDGGGAFAGRVLCAQPGLVDLDEPRLGAGLAQQQCDSCRAWGRRIRRSQTWPFSIRLGRWLPGLRRKCRRRCGSRPCRRGAAGNRGRPPGSPARRARRPPGVCAARAR